MPHRIVDVHRNRVGRVIEELEGIEGAARLAAQHCREVLEKGGQAHIQPQLQFLVGSYARLLKDCGVVEQLQAEGVYAKKVIK